MMAFCINVILHQFVDGIKVELPFLYFAFTMKELKCETDSCCVVLILKHQKL